MKNEEQNQKPESATHCVANLQKSTDEALAKIRDCLRGNPTDFDLPDSTDLIRADCDQ
ncbi:MAG: hypothetical protein KME35_11760 [Aphanocapsa sp. GSE-SYN-MK-11-07L]|jgi:hypothetical protein|nr:hypothetical protein [Aphanocapsa sp. GSE-SYN-MK-11-07L]